jgi:beta-glucosidase
MAQTDSVLRTTIDNAVANILRVKHDLGLFTNPFFSNSSNPNLATIGSAQDRNVSAQIVSESVTLLQNDGTLPLNPKVRQASFVTFFFLTI